MNSLSNGQREIETGNSEDETFKVLSRSPYEEAESAWSSADCVVESLKEIKIRGWTWNDFYKEYSRRKSR